MLGDITHAIQLAVALLSVLTGRLGRAIDRRRVLLSALAASDARFAAEEKGELVYVTRRIPVIYGAITMSVMGALLICLTIAAGFMAALIASLALFLREIYLAVKTVPSPLR
jgi:Protein of unknown function (DUF2721)